MCMYAKSSGRNYFKGVGGGGGGGGGGESVKAVKILKFSDKKGATL